MPHFQQLNLHKAEQATVLLAGDLAGKSNQVLLVTEPYSVAGKIVGMPSGMRTVQHYDSAQRPLAPRAGIIATADVQLRSLQSYCSRDCAAALARLHGTDTLVISAYLDINLPVIQPWLPKLLRLAATKKWAVLIGMDSNAHSPLFGPDSNVRGEELEDLILDHGLSVENLGNTPTFETRRGNCHIATHIDITLSRDLPYELQRWHVSQEYNASDHNLSLIHI